MKVEKKQREKRDHVKNVKDIAILCLMKSGR